ncbi:MAG TPA: response regulator [Thermodesulfovibrionales bacterium]|nr:response regulator [Thermodesulfovibrionales bacterium]
MGKKILVVEDNEINRKLFVSVLRERGHVVIEAANGREAIALIVNELPVLVLMDIVLPDMSGDEVLRTCKKKGVLGTTKVFALTASAPSDIRDAGFDGIIPKPVRVLDLLETVQEALEVHES